MRDPVTLIAPVFRSKVQERSQVIGDSFWMGEMDVVTACDAEDRGAGQELLARGERIAGKGPALISPNDEHPTGDGLEKGSDHVFGHAKPRSDFESWIVAKDDVAFGGCLSAPAHQDFRCVPVQASGLDTGVDGLVQIGQAPYRPVQSPFALNGFGQTAGDFFGRLAERAQSLQKDQSFDAIWKCPGKQGGYSGAHGMAEQRESFPTQAISCRFELRDAVDEMIRGPGREMIGMTMAGQIDGDEMGWVKPWSQPIE